LTVVCLAAKPYLDATRSLDAAWLFDTRRNRSVIFAD